MVKIRFSSALKKMTNTNEINMEVGETNIKSVLDQLIVKFGNDFGDRIIDNGAVRRFVNIYINGEDIRHLEGLESKIKDIDEISILPAVSGGIENKLKDMLCLKCKAKTFEIQKTGTGNLCIKCTSCNGVISPLQPYMTIKEFVQFWDIGLLT